MQTKLIRQTQKHQKYLQQIRSAFDEVDSDKDGKISKSEWCNSKIKNLFRDQQIQTSSFEQYFDKIDSNVDNYIVWSELVEFLIKELTSRETKKTEAAQFIKCSKINPNDILNRHRDKITQIYASHCTNEYVTISTDSIRFWSMHDLHHTRCFVKPGNFQCAIVFEPYQILSVATISRKLFFINLDTGKKLPVELSGSVTKSLIKNMTPVEAGEHLKELENNNRPLYNIPQCMLQSLIEGPDVIFFIGNDEGSVEAFKLVRPKRRIAENDYDLLPLKQQKYHNGSVTSLKALPTMFCYASSGQDGKVVFWQYSEQFSFTQPIKVFQEQSYISSFEFIAKYKLLIVCMPGKEATLWTAIDCKKRSVLTGNMNPAILVSEFVTVKGQLFILTVTKQREFRLFDVLNYRLVTQWKDLAPDRFFTAGLFDEKKNCYLTAGYQLFAWSEDLGMLDEYSEMHTHNFPIVGTHYSKKFGEIVTIDSKRTVYVWHINNGTREDIFIERVQDDQSEVRTSCLDVSERKMLVSDYKNKVSVWNYNSGRLLEELSIDSGDKSIVNVMLSCSISNREYLFRAGWDKQVRIFFVTAEEYDLKYTRKGHAYDISAICPTNNGFVSGSVGGELFCWILEKETAEAKVFTVDKIGVEKICYYKSNIIVSDSLGFISVYSLPKLTLKSRIKAHPLFCTFCIGTMCVMEDTLITADTLGYVRKWSISKACELEPIDFTRCHDCEINSVILIESGEFFVTTGVDRCVRVWKTETFEFVGTFGQEGKWSLKDDTTWVKDAPVKPDPKHTQEQSVPMEGPRIAASKSKLEFKSEPVNFKLSQSTPISAKTSKMNLKILPPIQELNSEVNNGLKLDVIKEVPSQKNSLSCENLASPDFVDEYEKELSAELREDDMNRNSTAFDFDIDKLQRTMNEYSFYEPETGLDHFLEQPSQTSILKNTTKTLMPVSKPSEIKSRITSVLIRESQRQEEKRAPSVMMQKKFDIVRNQIIKPSMTPPPFQRKLPPVAKTSPYY